MSRARGVIAASAGNHAQGVALAAERLACKATIVMPVTTPRIKVDAVRARGAEGVLHGDSYSDAYAHAVAHGRTLHATFVHPYDDPDVIAGQGTIGMEILRQWQGPLDAIFVAIGGGGLAFWWKPERRVTASCAASPRSREPNPASWCSKTAACRSRRCSASWARVGRSIRRGSGRAAFRSGFAPMGLPSACSATSQD